MKVCGNLFFKYLRLKDIEHNSNYKTLTAN
nr:MAG TPA: hypothetical protein [Caudoviricetes sp.]